MAPVRPSARRLLPQNASDQGQTHSGASNDPNVNNELFIDPMLGTPLAVYIEKDVEEKDELVRLVTAYGGTVSPGYSGVTYILVDPHKTSGQNLFRQYAGKKTKLVLSYRWIRECISANQLQTFSTNWAGCKVTGEEQVYAQSSRFQEDTTAHTQMITHEQPPPPQASTSAQPRVPSQPVMPYPMAPIPAVIVDPMNGFPHTVYAHPMHQQPHGMAHSAAAAWHTHPQVQGALPSNMIRPTHPQPYREDQTWDSYQQPQDGMASTHANYAGEYRYRGDHPPWLPPPSTSNGYYDPAQYESYAQATYMQEPAPAPEPAPVMEDPSSSAIQPQPDMSQPVDLAPEMGRLEPPERVRGRKRTRMQQTPATPAENLVNRSAPARSPTPPTRVIRSTYGGNLFTADDVMYLKKYIDHCQEQGLVLSLREICERVAVKAPHHTFYSWRRYCNKHQIRLGGYVMSAVARSDSPGLDDDGMEIEEEVEAVLRGGPGPSTSRMNTLASRADSSPRNRSPTPPRALFRSTTGKGVAFTPEDTTFLMKFLKYRESQGRVDMVQFWKDVAAKAPHHSRASWMKYWRRHKHELIRTDDEELPPPPPDKKMRYSREDDILLAKFFYEKREGTSDKLFQAFARQHPHHPWKGWQEHHRIHKTKIDHLIDMLTMGQNIDSEP
ncbi:hypothetical protein EST38_g778 [Candolleomyces aberdarensis]|uniref:DNA-binding protein RAP1 n=1 Tax=Candolleomyces aberdarensis TaxID=2316362 RepID=A0A4Q2DXQ1_9AGAR|nr:hypothetical protein EST38_g778 [Candolleomyces aberdarensis]